jgi:phosphoribosylglycinamide formyltransferase-1
MIPKIAIFASGAGSNAEKIINYSATDYQVVLIACNKPGAGVISIAEKNNIPCVIIEKEEFFRGNAYVNVLTTAAVDFIVLAGFLWKIPSKLIQAYPNKIVNIHPALLPKYGGKGMYGQHVHEAVIENRETESGITIHWVDEQYDHGSIILQAKCPVLKDDTAQTLAQRIHVLEHEHFPKVVAELASKI